ncbi:MAG: TolC family protein [Vicinamibacteraceae bacterium]
MGAESAAITRLIVTALLVFGLAMPAIGQGQSGARVTSPAASVTIGASESSQDPPQPAPQEPAQPTPQEPAQPTPQEPSQTPAAPQTPAPATGQPKPPVAPMDQVGLPDVSSAEPPPDPNARKLSIDDAVQLALENNLNLKVVRLNPLLSDLDIANARSNWTPTLFNDWSYRDAESPATSFIQGGSDQALAGNFGVEQVLPWGTRYSIGFNNSRRETSSFTDVNPSLNSTLELSFAQPLLQGFRIDGARQSLIVSRMGREVSDIQLRNDIIATTRNTRNAYWDFVNARGELAVARRTLAVSEQQLRENQKRVEVGVMAPIQVIEAEAEVARDRSNVIAAETAVDETEDGLKAVLFDPSAPDYWAMSLEPIDEPTVRLEPVNVEAAIKNALDNRTDLRQARTQLEINDVNIRYARDTTLPDLSLNVGYTTSGLGGTELVRDPNDPLSPGVPGPSRSYTDTLGDVFGLDFPTWSVGVSFSYPIGRSSQDVSLARARLQQRQAQLQIRDLERNVRQEIISLGRQVNTNGRLVQSTRVARELAEKNLEAAQKRFAVGLINQFEVIQRQRDLSTAQFDELGAMITYAKSLVDFEAAQEGAIFGGGGVTSASPGSGVGGGGIGVGGNGTGGNGNVGGNGNSSGNGVPQ